MKGYSAEAFQEKVIEQQSAGRATYDAYSTSPASRLLVVRESSVQKAAQKHISRRPTIQTFLPWNQNRKPLARYDLGWQATPKPHPGDGLSLTEIFWAYTHPGKGYATYPGLDKYVAWPTQRMSREDGKVVDLSFTRPDFPKYISKVAVDRAKRLGADGVMLDNWIDHKWRKMSVKDQKAARLQIARAIRRRAGDNFIILGNVNWSDHTATHRYINGVYMELFKDANKPYTSRQMREMERLMELHDHKLQEPRIVAVEAWRVSNGNRSEYSEENHRYARLFAAMATVVPRNGYFIYTDNNSDTDQHDHGHIYYDFYDIDLGPPRSRAKSIRNGIKYKLFRDGFVAYNRTRTPTKISFRGFPPITLGGETGLFCRFLHDRIDCSL